MYKIMTTIWPATAMFRDIQFKIFSSFREFVFSHGEVVGLRFTFERKNMGKLSDFSTLLVA